MSISSALLAATSGLSAAQSRIDVVSRNVANATNDDYTRKSQDLVTRVIGGQAQGVDLGVIERSVNEGLLEDIRTQEATVSELSVLDAYLERLVEAFGRPGDNDSISAKITDLKESIQVMSIAPELGANQAEVLRAAEAVAQEFQEITAAIADLRKEADRAIADTVELVNNALTNIEKLNDEIATRKTEGRTTADLEDSRDKYVQELSKYLNINVIERSNGELTILTGDSRLLLDDTKFPLTFTETALFTSTTAGQPLQIEDGLAGTATNPNISSEVSGRDGELAGLLRLRDTILVEAQDQLDTLAHELANDLDTFTINGTTAVVNLFVDAGGNVPADALGNEQGFAEVIRVNPTVTGTPSFLVTGNTGDAANTYVAIGSGDHRIANAMLDAFQATQTFVSGFGLTATNTIEGFAAELVGFQANQHATFESQLTFETNYRDTLVQSFRDESGVNTDEELAKLIELEAAFAASARVLQTVQQSLDELVNIIR
ncbi:MAG: flagellar hook-associated protein FlgK [Nisaea sp.]|jgi:flagellar hook-associated protein 1 FlgK|uniref:flagellar hook-associated protein FlgK n=1 Tax=Nisaea sp. TaxID=2024842 RepID=UPI001B2A967B|nr:flagellar hook-associated protein FlgK [Nisaea sp.]MBO6559990.1 flagellar hook-associated protein FlgK [Nisaea sp.]